MVALEQKLNYTFRNRALLENALRHSSYANESRDPAITSNERLEFLGDSVLGFVTAKYLYTHYPEMPEGSMTIWNWAIISVWVGARKAPAVGPVRPFWPTQWNL